MSITFFKKFSRLPHNTIIVMLKVFQACRSPVTIVALKHLRVIINAYRPVRDCFRKLNCKFFKSVHALTIPPLFDLSRDLG